MSVSLDGTAIGGKDEITQNFAEFQRLYGSAPAGYLPLAGALDELYANQSLQLDGQGRVNLYQEEDGTTVVIEFSRDDLLYANMAVWGAFQDGESRNVVCLGELLALEGAPDSFQYALFELYKNAVKGKVRKEGRSLRNTQPAVRVEAGDYGPYVQRYLTENNITDRTFI